jgi:hypothetical protein
MIIRLLVLLTLFVISSASFANGGCTKGSEFEPPLCPLRIKKILTIQIKENGVRNNMIAPEYHIDCSEFKLDTQKIRKFFLRAKIADKRAAHSTLDSSLCYASGTLKFANGEKVFWKIGHLQDGWLAIGDEGLLLYCPTCKFKPFVY